jgi:hydrogenase maturation protease
VDQVRAIADAVLYEGYLLWPYRRSALKNQRRWTFGGVYPEGHSRGRDDDPWIMRTQCLLLAGDPAAARVDVRVRFLHVIARELLDAGGRPVDELVADGTRHLAFDEATEREIASGPLALHELLRAPRRLPIDVPAGVDEERLGDAGAIVRRWEALAGSVLVAAQTQHAALRLTVEIRNTSPWPGGAREEALRRTFCSTHTVLEADGARFVSLTDPPEALRDAAAACSNDGTWPVLVGPPGEDRTLLSSPIILEDHPRIAAESPGDLFDGGEIDQLLTLSILALTDEEKAEMRDTDPRTRAILERTESLTSEQLMRLHAEMRK